MNEILPIGNGGEEILAVEELISQHAKAKDIFEQLRNARRDLDVEYEVSVIGRVTPAGTSEEDFWVGSEGNIFTTQNPEPGSGEEKALDFAHAFMKHLDEFSGADENNLSLMEHVISTVVTGGIKPEIGDILLEKKVGGYLGYPRRVRVLKPNTTDDEVKAALDFITS